jgi:hypothetical protein
VSGETPVWVWGRNGGWGQPCFRLPADGFGSSFILQPCPRLVVIELQKPGVPGLAPAFIQGQRDESALLSSRRDKRENCDTL